MAERKKRRWWRCLAAFGIVVLLIGVVPVAAIEGLCRAPLVEAPAAPSSAPVPDIRDAGYRRSELNTYFTFPEWYIVYSAEDFGRFLDRQNESAFPYLRHIAGFWQSFCGINRIASSRGTPQLDVKVMIYFIGVSYSVELAIKALYENTVGRLTEWTRGPARTPEDIYARTVAQDYALFLYTIPWYQYPFFRQARGLWSDTPLGGPALVRRWERKLALTAEYGIKAGYAWVTQKLLDVGSEPEAREIMLVVGRLPPEVLAKEPRIRLVRAMEGDRQLILVPRYQAFTEIVMGLARAGQSIVEIAGNDDILITAILPAGPAPKIDGTRELFSLPLGARPGFRRAGFDVRVDQLTRAIPELERAGATVEHLYDY